MIIGNSAVGLGPDSTAAATGVQSRTPALCRLITARVADNSVTGSGFFSADQRRRRVWARYRKLWHALDTQCLFSQELGHGRRRPGRRRSRSAIFNTGTLTVTSGKFYQNSALSGLTAGEGGIAYGGVIMNFGKASLDAGIGGNSAEGGSQAFGGAIYNAGTLSIAGCPLSGSAQAGSDSYGGAIYNDDTGTATITGSSVGGSAAGLVGTGDGAGPRRLPRLRRRDRQHRQASSVAETYFLDAAVGSPSPLAAHHFPATADFGYGGAINNAGLSLGRQCHVHQQHGRGHRSPRAGRSPTRE